MVGGQQLDLTTSFAHQLREDRKDLLGTQCCPVTMTMYLDPHDCFCFV